MRFTSTDIPDLFVIDLERHTDDRGFFARSWCAQEFAGFGLNAACVQCNVSHSARRGTLRGMHYQAAPSEEAKTIRVVRGAIHDVVLDLRPSSPTFRRWFATELTADGYRMLYVPEGCAHGFLTLTDDCELFYQMTAAFDLEAARGVRWNDPLLAGAWPFEPVLVSERDASFSDLPVAA